MIIVTPSVQAQSFSVLHYFTGPDGAVPRGGLILDKAGNLYGATTIGGSGYGTVFKLDTAGTETVLWAFTPDNGSEPSATLLRDGAGNLYGTTFTGSGPFGLGVVFKLDTTNTETVLHRFNGPDGARPVGDLTRDTAGNLYGTTPFGGRFGHGTVFKLAATSKENSTGTKTVLHSFNGSDGDQSFAGLVLDELGNLYGTTAYGGTFNAGTVFKVDSTGTETVLYTFTGGADGAVPNSGLVRDTAGNFYGTTVRGGISGRGTVFKLDTMGTETVLHSFNTSDGTDPYSGLVRDTAGNLYGTTSNGGISDNGTVFKVTP